MRTLDTLQGKPKLYKTYFSKLHVAKHFQKHDRGCQKSSFIRGYERTRSFFGTHRHSVYYKVRYNVQSSTLSF